MMIPIYFVDRQGQRTSDLIEGCPVVDVDIAVGVPVDPIALKAVTQFPARRCVAQIDSGANHVMIDLALTEGAVSLRPLIGTGVGNVLQSDCYQVLIVLPGVPAVHIEAGSAPLRQHGDPFDVILGRSLLQHFRVLLDFPAQKFELEYCAIEIQNDP